MTRPNFDALVRAFGDLLREGSLSFTDAPTPNASTLTPESVEVLQRISGESLRPPSPDHEMARWFPGEITDDDRELHAALREAERARAVRSALPKPRHGPPPKRRAVGAVYRHGRSR